jgi:hypothetical protein
MQSYDWDHVDPDYPKGCDRPYQMVCGFTNPLNLVERDRSLNSSKSNRFLPWRVAHDEVGSVPVNPGDLCQFLNRETGEWVLEEFMGDWWFKQTRDLCGQSLAGTSCRGKSYGIGVPGKISGAKKAGMKTFIGKIGIHAPGMASKGGKAGKGNPGLRKNNGKKVNSTKLICLITGTISISGPLTRYQTKRGISPSLRAPLETVHFIIKSLCLITQLKTAKQ